MYVLLLIIVIGVPIIELWGLITVGSWLGAWNALGMARGGMPGQVLLVGLCFWLGGGMLLAPGFFRDTLGGRWLVPSTRDVARDGRKRVLYKWIQSGRFRISKL